MKSSRSCEIFTRGFIILAALLAPSFSFAGSTAADGVLATVNGEKITEQDIARALKGMGRQGEMVSANPELKKKFLDHFINSKLVANQAKKEGFESNAVFQQHLKEVTEQLLAGDFMDHYISAKANDVHLEKFFNDNKESFSKKEIRASHCLVESEAEAKKILLELRAKPSQFDDIAKKHSKDKSVDLGFFGHGKMVPEFEKAAFSLKKGEISKDPIKTTFGWHIIKVTDERGDMAVKFTEVKGEVASKYRAQLQESLMKDLRSKAVVTFP
jgi:peptidyl-prolyl cis-trans isomerase C